MDPVVQHKHAQHHHLGNSHDRLSINHGRPVGHQAGIVQRGKNLSDRLAAFFMTDKNLLHRCGLLEQLGGVGDRRRVHQREPRRNSGKVAMCNASSPAVCDFSCGFHRSLSCGTRSRNLRVVFAACSNSLSMAPAMDISAPVIKSIESSRPEISVQQAVRTAIVQDSAVLCLLEQLSLRHAR